MAWFAPWTWGRAAPALPDPETPDDAIVGAGGRVAPACGRGWSGTSVYSGRVSGVERNPDLVDPARWCQVARDMVRTDPTIAAAWEATRSTLLAAKWGVEPGDETDELSCRMAEELASNLGLGGRPRAGLARPFEFYVGQALRYVLTGHRYGEVGWDVTDDGRVVIRHAWLDRDPTAHDRWILDPVTRELAGVTQRMPTGDAAGTLTQAPFIPADELVLLVRDQEGDDYNGNGILRACYRPWREKRELLNLQMRAAEAWSVPTPNVVVDYMGALSAAIANGLDETAIRPEVAAEAEAVRASVDDFVRGDSGRMESTPYVRLESFGGTNEPSDLLALLDSKDVSLLTAFLLQMLRLGVDNPARSVSETHASVWRRSLINVIEYFAESWGGTVIPRWVAFNYGDDIPEELHPKLRASGLEADTVLEVLDRLGDLADRGLLGHWGGRDVADLRRRLTLDPEEDEPADAGLTPPPDLDDAGAMAARRILSLLAELPPEVVDRWAEAMRAGDPPDGDPS